MNDTASDLVKVHLDLPNHWWFKGESLWAKSLGNDLYEIQNVPFCAYGLSCGDVVRATPDAPDLKPEVREVVRRSGNRTLRASFSDHLTKDLQQPHIKTLESLGAWVERANPQFVCINVPPVVDYEEICAYLAEQERAGELEYETCEARVTGSFDDQPGESTEDEA
jgi:hypothetical protein